MAITISGSGITSANIADGTIVNADINSSAAIDGTKVSGSFGKVLQVLQIQDTTTTSVSTATWTDVGLSLNITPISTTSKIYAIWSVQGNMTNNNSGFGSRLMRNAAVATQSAAYEAYTPYSQLRSHVTRSYIDSPALDTAITYKIQVSSPTGATVAFNENGVTTELTLMEIGA